MGPPDTDGKTCRYSKGQQHQEEHETLKKYQMLREEFEKMWRINENSDLCGIFELHF